MTNNPNQTQVAGIPGAQINPLGAGGKEQASAKVTQVSMKEAAIVVAAVLFIAGVVGGYWFYKHQKEAHATGNLNAQTEENPSIKSLGPPAGVASPVSTFVPAPAIKSTDSVHADIYFDFDRSRLRADAVTILMEKSEVLKKDGNWSVLVQGHADQNGPIEYNRGLALRRAQAVQQFLVELGVPATAIKVVTIGKEGTICDDQGKECQRLNRRVHIEMRNLGSVPVAQAPGSTESTEPEPSAVTQ